MGGVDEQTTRIAREPVPILDAVNSESSVATVDLMAHWWGRKVFQRREELRVDK
jgi:hypothetical protein